MGSICLHLYSTNAFAVHLDLKKMVGIYVIAFSNTLYNIEYVSLTCAYYVIERPQPSFSLLMLTFGC